MDAQKSRPGAARRHGRQWPGSGGVVVPVVPDPVVPVPVAPAPERVMPVPDVPELPEVPVAPDAPDVSSVPELPDEPDELLPEVPWLPGATLSEAPDVDEPVVPDVEEPLVEAGGVLFMPLVPLAPRQESVPPVLPAPLAPVPPVVPISVELEPAVPLAPDVVRSWLPVLCCFALVDLFDWCFLSLEVCLSEPEACEPVEADCAATPALTSMAARITVSFVFMEFSFCLWVPTAS